MLLAKRVSGVSVFVAPVVGLLLISAGCMERWEPRMDGIFDPNPPDGGNNDGGAGGTGGGGGGSGGEEIIQEGIIDEPGTTNDQVQDIKDQAPIGKNALVRGTFETQADVDYYKVVLREDRHLSIKLSDGKGLCGNLHTRLQLFNATDPSSALFDDESIKGGDCAAITEFLKQGTYYIGAEQLGDSVSSSLDYAIEFRFLDEHREDAPVLKSRHVVVSGSIHSSGLSDVDVFDITLQEGESIHAEIRGVESPDCKEFSSQLSVDKVNGSGWLALAAEHSEINNCPHFRPSDYPNHGLDKGGKFKITVSKLEGGPDFAYKLFITVHSDNWMTSWSGEN